MMRTRSARILRRNDDADLSARFVACQDAAGESPVTPARRVRAFTLIELIVVISILSLIVLVVPLNLFGALLRSSFKSQVQELVSVMQMAASAASEKGGRYEVIVNLGEQSYLLRRITGTNLQNVLDEEIITQGQFGEHCHVSYVEFDDSTYTNDGTAKFRVSHAGWHYGGKIVLLDDEQQPHTVVVTRLNPIVSVVDGDPTLLKPKTKDDLPFR
jgi:prepilin-type N-terminal cleavage/methylation domain-containing protein